MSCGYQQETEREKCIRQFNIAKEVYKRIESSKFDGLPGDVMELIKKPTVNNSVQIVLQRHIVCLINEMGKISLQIGVKK